MAACCFCLKDASGEKKTLHNQACETIDNLNYATGIGIRPRNPVTICVVFFWFHVDVISGYTFGRFLHIYDFLAYGRFVVRYLGSISTLSYP